MRTRPSVVLALLTTSAAVAAFTASARTAEPTKSKEKKPARTDRYGDPLPERAVMRLGTLRFCQPYPRCLAFSPDGKVLASCGSENRIRLWDPNTGKEVRALEGHESSVVCIAFSKDGKTLASLARDATVRIWDVASGKNIKLFRMRDAESLTLSPNGKLLAVGGRAVCVWDIEKEKVIRTWKPAVVVYSILFSPDSKILAVGATNSCPAPGRLHRQWGELTLWDTSTWKRVKALVEGHADHITSLAFSADGKALFTRSADCATRLWDVASGKEKRRFSDQTKVESEPLGNRMALAPDGKTLTFCACDPNNAQGPLTWDFTVHIWDLVANNIPSRTAARSVSLG
jgi:WD40 repeat protein